MKKNILYLCHRIPYPPNKGDKIRSFNEIKYLAENNTIDLISFADDPEDLKYMENLKMYCRQVMIFPLNKVYAKIKGFSSLLTGKSISQGYFYQNKFQNIVNRWIDSEEYDFVICFSSPMAEYIFKGDVLKKDSLSVKLIMDFCDLDSDKWLQYSKRTLFPLNCLYKKEASRLLKFEKKINNKFNQSIFISKQEAGLFRQYYPEAANLHVIPNGVDYEYFSFQKKISNSFPTPMLMFSGAMDYYANIDGVVWFAKKIFPEIKKIIPDVKFYIVGNNPDKNVKDLEKDSSIIVTGFVKDIREYYQAADICVIPLRIARGIQNKVLEAMSSSKPVVTTSITIQGINALPQRDLMVAESVLEFAQTVINLLEDPERMRKLGNSARKFVKENHDWKENLKLLNSQMNKLKVS
ncbi:MAG: TIGR03087 family PEP-CTERM/XrtA system glycosyltransferase [Desulfobacula sp.]|nr:TIGR03087 family PEP-CTERM/XrtA system glycosyltransferase [Desulfobacula sp.]